MNKKTEIKFLRPMVWTSQSIEAIEKKRAWINEIFGDIEKRKE
jgi:hypothetical protein